MVNTEDEFWKDVVGYGDLFSVSNKGQIFSKRTDKVLKQNPVSTGYNACMTRIGGRKGTCVCLRAHREVAKAFIPNPNNLPFVNHIDGDKLNNSVENLEWVTPRENVRYALALGLSNLEHLKDSNKAFRKLSEEDVKYIKTYYKPFDRNFGARALARNYGVCKETILSIVHGESYLDVV